MTYELCTVIKLNGMQVYLWLALLMGASALDHFKNTPGANLNGMSGFGEN